MLFINTQLCVGVNKEVMEKGLCLNLEIKALKAHTKKPCIERQWYEYIFVEVQKYLSIKLAFSSKNMVMHGRITCWLSKYKRNSELSFTDLGQF